jgi:hypothetical protein
VPASRSTLIDGATRYSSRSAKCRDRIRADGCSLSLRSSHSDDRSPAEAAICKNCSSALPRRQQADAGQRSVSGRPSLLLRPRAAIRNRTRAVRRALPLCPRRCPTLPDPRLRAGELPRGSSAEAPSPMWRRAHGTAVARQGTPSQCRAPQSQGELLKGFREACAFHTLMSN